MYRVKKQADIPAPLLSTSDARPAMQEQDFLQNKNSKNIEKNKNNA